MTSIPELDGLITMADPGFSLHAGVDRVQVERALALAPDSYEVNYAAARCFLTRREFRRAIDHYETAANLVATDYVAAGMLPGCYAAQGDTEGARKAAQRALTRCEQAVAIEVDNGSAMGFLVTALATLGEHERMREWMERAILLDPNNLNMQYNFACILIRSLNDVDGALQILTPLFSVFVADSLHWVQTDPALDTIRNDPRFQALLAQAKARVAG